MKTKLILATLLISLALVVIARADIPRVMNFQGKATDKQGAPLNGPCKLTVRIYDAETSTGALWMEVHDNVAVGNGIFQVLLGSKTPLDLPFDKNYWVSAEIGTDGEMTPRTRLASVGYAYKAEPISGISVPFYTEGLELEYVDQYHIKVASGAADINGKILAAQNYSSPISIQDDGNYIQGCNDPLPWIYVYLYNNNDRIAYILADKAPDKADYQGSVSGRRYYVQAGIPYRCIGAVRTDNGNKAGSLIKFFQRGNLVMWDVPVNITTTLSNGEWSMATSCSAGMPSISTLAIFGLQLDCGGSGGGLIGFWIKPNGSTWSTDFGNGIYHATYGYSLGGQRFCMTDSSQQIQYRTIVSGSVQTAAIDVEGYLLDIR